MAAGIPAALAAKAATTTIPIVFEIADDPVEIGLVASLNRPGGNLTGVTTLNVELAPKRLELLHEVVPTTRSIALLVDAGNPVNERLSTDTQTAAQTLGLHLHVLHARTERDFDTVFASTVQMQVGALVINNGPLFLSRVEQVAALTVRHAVPAISAYREFAAAGGLMSYGGGLTEAYRLTGVNSAGFSRARGQLTCRFSRLRRSSCSSISKPPRLLASPCRNRCAPPPTT